MKISYRADYALKAVLDLCFHSGDGNVVPVADIAKRQDIPLKFLEQILLILKKSGYVHSKTGKSGGFLLAKRPDQITPGEIIRIVEGPIEPIACAVPGKKSGCAEEERCAFQEVWLKVAEAVSSVVDAATFADIMRRTRELRETKTDYVYHI